MRFILLLLGLRDSVPHGSDGPNPIGIQGGQDGTAERVEGQFLPESGPEVHCPASDWRSSPEKSPQCVGGGAALA